MSILKNIFLKTILIIVLLGAFSCEKPEEFTPVDSYGFAYMRCLPDSARLYNHSYNIFTYGLGLMYDNKRNVEYIIDSQKKYEDSLLSKGYYLYPPIDFTKTIVYVKSHATIALSPIVSHSVSLFSNETQDKYLMEHTVSFNEEEYMNEYYSVLYFTLPKLSAKDIIVTNVIENSHNLVTDKSMSQLQGNYIGTYYKYNADTISNFTLEITDIINPNFDCANCAIYKDSPVLYIYYQDSTIYNGIIDNYTIVEDMLYYSQDNLLTFKFFFNSNEIEIFTLDGFYTGQKQ